MKLYYTSSVCSLAVRILLHELGLSCEYEAVNLKTKQTHSDENYLDINPKGSVPALLLNNGEILTENAVILQYLTDTHQAHNMLPAVGDMKRYRTLEWLNYISTDLHRYCSPLFWSKMPIEVKQDLYTPILHNKLAIVDKHLQNNTFLMGNEFSIADPYLIVILVWLAKLNMPMTPWPNLIRYYTMMKEREAVRLALTEENLNHL